MGSINDSWQLVKDNKSIQIILISNSNWLDNVSTETSIWKVESADFERRSPVGFAGNMLESKLIITGEYITKKDFDRVKIPGGPKREFLI